MKRLLFTFLALCLAVALFIYRTLYTTYNANEGQIFVFDRKGKICHTFNHKGGSGEEYNYPLQLRLDEKAKELFLLDISNKIQVYSIEGKYKRSCTD